MKKAILELDREQFLINIPEEIHLISRMSDYIAEKCIVKDKEISIELQDLMNGTNDCLLTFYFAEGVRVFARTDLEITMFLDPDREDVSNHVVFAKMKDIYHTN